MAWLVLVVLTAVSWALGTDHGVGGRHIGASVVIIAVAVFKIRLVALYFMELRQAPAALHGIFEGYCVLLFIVLTGMYLLA